MVDLAKSFQHMPAGGGFQTARELFRARCYQPILKRSQLMRVAFTLTSPNTSTNSMIICVSAFCIR